jgi:hypothetical protein
MLGKKDVSVGHARYFHLSTTPYTSDHLKTMGERVIG